MGQTGFGPVYTDQRWGKIPTEGGSSLEDWIGFGVQKGKFQVPGGHQDETSNAPFMGQTKGRGYRVITCLAGQGQKRNTEEARGSCGYRLKTAQLGHPTSFTGGRFGRSGLPFCAGDVELGGQALLSVVKRVNVARWTRFIKTSKLDGLVQTSSVTKKTQPPSGIRRRWGGRTKALQKNKQTQTKRVGYDSVAKKRSNTQVL